MIRKIDDSKIVNSSIISNVQHSSVVTNLDEDELPEDGMP